MLALGLTLAAALTVPSFHGDALYEYRTFADGSTDLNQLMVINAVAGTKVDLATHPDAHRTTTADASGVVDLRKLIRFPLTAQPGGVLKITLTDPAGRSKVLQFVARDNRGPEITSSCFAADGTEIGCLVRCDTSATVAPGDPCEGAGNTIRIPHGRTTDEFTGNRRYTQVKKLRITKIPPNATVVALCEGKKCPFFLRPAPPRNGTVDVAKFVGRYHFKPGQRLSVWVMRGVERGDVVRYTFRAGRLPRFQTLCMPARSLTPEHC